MMISLIKCDVVLPGRWYLSAPLDIGRPYETLFPTKPHGVTSHSTVSSEPQLNVTSLTDPISPVPYAASNYVCTNSMKQEVFLFLDQQLNT
jgi:hypothetical protein